MKDLSCKERTFSEAIKKELDKTCDVERSSVEGECTRKREAIKNGAKEVFGFQKTRNAKNHG